MNKKPDLRQRFALELYRHIRKNEVKLHELRTLFWECTLRCNAACRHCGSDCHVSSTHPDMPISDFLGVIDEIGPQVNPNHVMIVFTGGEALVRSDIEQCGIELYRRGFPWGIVSNGILLTRERLDSLLSAGMHTATISLDGFEKDHVWLRGNPHSFEGASNAIRMLTDEKEIIWDVVTCANRKNIDYLPKFKEYLIELGVKRWRLFTIFPLGRAAHISELQLTDEQFTTLLDFISGCRKDGRIRVDYGCEGFLGYYEGKVRHGLYHCDAGISTASILIDGSISGCPSIRSHFYQGNIYQDNFMDVWNKRFENFRHREWARKGECKECKMFRYCEGNGMHLHDDEGNLLMCHYKRIVSK